MSPEQASGDGADARSDIYALGILLFQMIAGRAPFTADTPVGLLVKQIKELPPPLTKVAPNAGITEELESFVMRLLSKSPRQRPQTAEEVRDTLREIAFRRLWTTPPPPVGAWRTPPPQLVPAPESMLVAPGPILPLTTPPPADPRAVRALATHPELASVTLSERPKRSSRGERVEITPPPDLESMDLPFTLRHPWVKWAGGAAGLLAGAGLAGWFLLSPAPEGKLEGTKQVVLAPSTASVSTARAPIPSVPERAPDPPITKSAPQPAVAEAKGSSGAAALDDDAALDRAIAKDLTARPAAKKAKPAPPPEQPQLKRTEPELNLDKSLDEIAPRKLEPEEKPPEPKLEQKDPALEDGPMPVEIE